MKKIIKLLGLLLGITILAIVAAIIIVPFIFDPNDYKDEFTGLVDAKTGRQLVIEGDIELSIFPWLGAEVGRVSLSNAAGFEEASFASFEQAKIKIKLLSLFKKQPEISTITLNGLSLNLGIDKTGNSNWQDLISEEHGVSEPTPSEVTTAAETAPIITAISIGGVAIQDARIQWRDQSMNTQYLLQDLNLSTGPIRLDQPFDITVVSNISSQAPALRGQISIDSRLSLDLDAQRYAADNIQLALMLAGEEIPNGEINLNVEANIVANLQQESLAISNLIAQLNDTTINGTTNIQNFSSPKINFNLELDKLDLDRYMPTDTDAPPVTPASAATAGVIELPLETLRALNLDGTITLGTMKMANLDITQLALTARAHEGVIKLHPISAELYEGKYEGNVQLDARGDVPVFSMNEKLSGLQAGLFLQDLLDTDFISGTADATITIRTQGNNIDDLLKQLSGNMAFSFQEGRVNGLNLIRSIKEDYVKITKQLVEDTSELNQTVFSTIQGSFAITNGLANTENLFVSASQFDANGKGTADLVTENLNFTVEITPKKQLEKIFRGLDGLTIPFYIKGTFSEPTFKSGIKDLLKKIGKEKLQKEKERLKAKLKAQQERIEVEAKAKQAELETKLAEEKARLQKEFDEKKKQEEERLKNKVKDKLKDLFR